MVRVIKSRSVRWVGRVACMDYNKNAYRVLDGMPGKKAQLGRPRCSWEGNIKMDLKEVGQKCVSWIHLS